MRRGIPPIEDYNLPSAAELPSNIAQWKPCGSRSVLLVHDMQRYFLRNFPDPLRTSLIDNVSSAISASRASGARIAFTGQSGGMTKVERGLLADFWGPGMETSDHDRELPDLLRREAADWSLIKWRYSAFFKTDLLNLMRADRRDQLVICGVYAHIGVLATAIESYSNDIETFLIGDGVADFTKSDHEWALRYAATRCAVVVNVTSFLS